MKLINKFFEIEFAHEISKNAYLDACKWLAKYVYGNDKLSDIVVDIQKIKPKTEEELTKFKVTLFVTLDKNEFDKDYCDKCHEIHKIWFINDNANCSECKFNSSRKQMANKVNLKADYRKEVLDRIFEKEKKE